VNHSARHKYYVKKAMKWFEQHGWTAKEVEQTYTIPLPGGRSMFCKKDFWGADICCRKRDELLIFVQVKTSDKQIREGVRQLTTDDNWPVAHARRAVLYWPKGKQYPEMVEVIDGRESKANLRPCDQGP
jgi:hypothetical protein